MSEFVKGLNKNEGNDIQYKGNAFLRLMGYVKPYWKTVVICCLLVAALTALELYRPELIGNAIDRYILTIDATAAFAAPVQDALGEAHPLSALAEGILALSAGAG